MRNIWSTILRKQGMRNVWLIVLRSMPLMFDVLKINPGKIDQIALVSVGYMTLISAIFFVFCEVVLK